MPVEPRRTSPRASAAHTSSAERSEKFFPNWSIALHPCEGCIGVPQRRVPCETNGGNSFAAMQRAKSETAPKERHVSFLERQQTDFRFLKNLRARGNRCGRKTRPSHSPA